MNFYVVEYWRAPNFSFQLHAISYRLKNPLPTNVASEQETDFSHVADFASQVRHLVVEGNNEFHRYYGFLLIIVTSSKFMIMLAGIYWYEIVLQYLVYLFFLMATEIYGFVQS